MQEKISKLENIVTEIIQNETHTHTHMTSKKHEQSIIKLWDNFKKINFCPVPVPEGLGRHKKYLKK